MLPPTPLAPPILSRRSLPYIPIDKSPTSNLGSPATSPARMPMGSLDAYVISIAGAMVCAVIIGLVLNTVIRFALHVAKQLWSQSDPGQVNPVNNVGVKRNALRALPTLVYSARLRLPWLDTECTICLSEFVSGEHVRVLPRCSHGFHAGCINQWLSDHPSCPTCRQCSFRLSQLVVGHSEAAGTEPGQVHLVSLPQADIENGMENCRLWVILRVGNYNLMYFWLECVNIRGCIISKNIRGCILLSFYSLYCKTSSF